MTTSHTPGPWFIYDDGLGDESSDCIMANLGDAKVDIAYMSTDENTGVPVKVRKANAAFIVKACNSHDDLLFACKSMLSFLNRTKYDTSLLEAAIAKAS